MLYFYIIDLSAKIIYHICPNCTQYCLLKLIDINENCSKLTPSRIMTRISILFAKILNNEHKLYKVFGSLQ